MEKKALFRMTKKRELLLSGIITTINIKWESVTGLARLLIEEIPDEEKREKRKEENRKEEEKWSMVLDVLGVVMNHNDDFFRELHMKEKRNWKSEWDVPDEAFNKAIDHAIELLTWFEENSVMVKPPDSRRNYKKRVSFLEDLRIFRLTS